jgi:hypothetical protein
VTSEAAVTVVKDMAVTHAEFARGIARLLPARATGRDSPPDNPLLQFPWSGGMVEVHLGPEAVRRLGMMAIPTTRVVLVFKGLNADERREFIRQFDLRFQRGGG